MFVVAAAVTIDVVSALLKDRRIQKYRDQMQAKILQAEAIEATIELKVAEVLKITGKHRLAA
jgi:hypothetical protein